MDLVEPHSHAFQEQAWPFDIPVNTAAYASVQVIRDDAPVLVVYHDHDGDWQFLHGDVSEDDEGVLVCMGCAYQRTPAISLLAQMPSGWRAERTSVAGEWVTEPYPDRDD